MRRNRLSKGGANQQAVKGYSRVTVCATDSTHYHTRRELWFPVIRQVASTLGEVEMRRTNDRMADVARAWGQNRWAVVGYKREALLPA